MRRVFVLLFTLVASSISTSSDTLVLGVGPSYVQERPGVYNKLNEVAGATVLYEVQIESANGCDPNVGSRRQRLSCSRKPAPNITYQAFDGNRSKCPYLNFLEQIRTGTLEDMMAQTSDFHEGITLRYIKERVGASTVWVMPLFPNNAQWNIPDPCDNLGSPYAVRDYLHIAGRVSQSCFVNNKDGHVSDSCWGNDEFERFLEIAHNLGLRVILDMAFNHFGHHYEFYDYEDFIPVHKLGNLNLLWDYATTFDRGLVHPRLLDKESSLSENTFLTHIAAEVSRICPGITGKKQLQLVSMKRNALDHEFASWDCQHSPDLYLEAFLPSFFLGPRNYSEEPRPALNASDIFIGQWPDVKYLYHHEYHCQSYTKTGPWDFYSSFVRNREYLFRVLNYWVSLGVDGFRLDHSTDSESGLGPNEWKYIIGKVNYYDWIRKGRPSNHIPPLYMAEEYYDQPGMNHVVDIIVDGFIGDVRLGRDCSTIYKDSGCLELQVNKGKRFEGHSLVLRALETHDEPRLLSYTGFDEITGGIFWSAIAATPGTSMVLMGQEFGEPWGVGFRRSDFLRSRFRETSSPLTELYYRSCHARTEPENAALWSNDYYLLRPRESPQEPNPLVYAIARWNSNDNAAIFAFHYLWGGNHTVSVSYFIPPDLASQIQMKEQNYYQLVNILRNDTSPSPCMKGADIMWDFPVTLSNSTRVLWLKLVECR
ncbi:hypothetical protein Pelo_14343 [Pelomyxa schiedti]|nr:hypothetical protein Pelo_14343 [Pelomyxa schiedti]